MRTTIKYRRRLGEYHVMISGSQDEAGILARFPTGHKADAEVWQLQHERPDIALLVATMAARHPELKGRVFRGGQILANVGVRWEGGRIFMVNSQTNPGDPPYRVTLNHRACTCPDWENGRMGHKYGAPIIKGRPVCKHIVAATLFEQLAQEEENHG